jgi:hypothetical protein
MPNESKNTYLKRMNFRLTKTLWNGIYPSYHYLTKETRKDLCLMISIPVFIKDPAVALEEPTLGIQEIEVPLDMNLAAGPTSARACVVDFNADTQTLHAPIEWDPAEGWFKTPGEDGNWLPDPPQVAKNIEDPKRVQDPERYKNQYLDFIVKTVRNPFFHQLNVWAVVQRVLEFYEEPQALGRPVPWGFDGNRLIIVPHAGYGENAYYDRRSKSLQFYYFGDVQKPCYTCLSHDIIAHETGHAILDGVRPLYIQLSSVQTLAFHEFIADLTAILLALHNKDIRRFVSQTSQGLEGANVMADLAKEFGQEVTGRDYLRSAFNDKKMADIKDSLVPHTVSQVLTGAMWDILVAIAKRHLAKNEEGQKVSPAQALWWAADRFRRVALQPLDLCPPCDIQFVDYAKAVINNDIITNPVDEQGYRPIMLSVFHERGVCDCEYKPDQEMPEDCLFREVMDQERIYFVFHDIERISRSRTAAYYFLSDNRRQLHIPPHQDVRVVDLYDAIKYGAAAERLPREVVLEYTWQEVVPLTKTGDLDFGAWNGKVFYMDCGGTLVFDGRGNLLSWSRKPGTEHLRPEEARKLRNKAKPTKLDKALLDDLRIGEKRKQDLLTYLSRMIKRGLVGSPTTGSPFSETDKPITLVEDGDAIRLEMAPHLSSKDFEREEEEWLTNF